LDSRYGQQKSRIADGFNLVSLNADLPLESLEIAAAHESVYDVGDGARSQQRVAGKVIVATNHIREPSTCKLPRSGLDIAKHVFQVHAIDAEEKVVIRKQLRRGQVMQFFEELPPCLVGLEACATSHYWVRELSKLGHEVRLMPAKDVKAYVKRNKNDAADAEAICEAVRRPTMRFVQVKSAEQQAQLMQHRARDLLMQQRTQLDQRV